MDWTLLGAVGATGSGFVLLSAGGWKLRHRPAFALTLAEHGRVVAAHAGRLAWAVPLVELALGLGVLMHLLPPSARPGPLPLQVPALGTVLLGAVFTAYAGAQLARGRRPRCGCLDSRDRLGPHTVVRAAAICSGGLGGLLTAAASRDGTPAPVPASVWVITVAAGGLVVAAVLVVGLPLLADAGRSADGDRGGTGGHQLADHRRARHLSGDKEPS
ncbi:MauE/DoxX family redox-associated membrane protein [Streptomyces sp. NPDC047108]|uniref:MauE/DoxX family redox-associated membrane protein n=1 Tax=Streptomyces sp. NPDC047108 TaxID=3155025 RepID=UPI0034049431